MDTRLPTPMLRKLQVVAASMMMGPTVLCIIAIAAVPAGMPTDDATMIVYMSVTHLALAFFAGIAWLVGHRLLRARARREAPEVVLQQAMIVRYMVLEGVALYGLVVVMLARMMGVLATQPWVWLNLGSFFAMWLIGILVFPTAGGMRRLRLAFFGDAG